MGMYFPPLYCPKGSILEVIKTVDLNSYVIEISRKCYVQDIIGYGFDIYPLWNKDKIFRIANSELPDYFKVLAAPEIDKLDIMFSNYKARFIKDFSIKNLINIKKGSEYYFEIDRANKDFFDLYNEYRKVMRLNDKEANEFLEFIDN